MTQAGGIRTSRSPSAAVSASPPQSERNVAAEHRIPVHVNSGDPHVYMSEGASTIASWCNAQPPSTVTAHSPRLRTALRAASGTVPLLLLLLWRFVVWRRAGIDIRVAIVRRLDLATNQDRQVRLLHPSEWRAVEPYVEKAAEQARTHPDRRDLFLCHAWDDRQGSAADLHRQSKANGASVWFSEEDIPLGSLMTREIDKGLRSSDRDCAGDTRATQEHQERGHRREGTRRAAQ